MFGYSMGAGVALMLTVKHPEMVRKVAFASVMYNTGGLHPGLIDGLAGLKPEHMMGSPWQVEDATIAPCPEIFLRWSPRSRT